MKKCLWPFLVRTEEDYLFCGRNGVIWFYCMREGKGGRVLVRKLPMSSASKKENGRLEVEDRDEKGGGKMSPL